MPFFCNFIEVDVCLKVQIIFFSNRHVSVHDFYQNMYFMMLVIKCDIL